MKYKHVNLPINIEYYYFDTFSIEWDQEDEDRSRPPFPETADLEAEIEHISHDEEYDVWSVTLDASASLAENEDDDALLFFDARVVGIFTSRAMLKDADLPEGHALIGSTAASALYGALRERLASATAASPYGAYYLPVAQLFFPPKEIKVRKSITKKTASAEAREKKEHPVARQAHLKFVKE